MSGNTNRFSTYTAASGGSGSKAEQKEDLWNSLLASVASGKRLPEKNLLVLGGTVDSQREFFELLSNQDYRGELDRGAPKLPPVANSFALGYTYYDVLDADQEDTLARISIHTLTNPSAAFGRLLEPLLTPQSIPNTLIVILLDWSQPWKWMRQLREWILLLRTVFVSLGNECTDAMEETMLSWRDRGRSGGPNLDGTPSATAADGDVALPLGPGEWEDALGLPLCVVCQNAEQMELLEKTYGWKEEDFDVVLQYMRTVLLRHGASLIYTTPAMSTPLQSLVHSSLGIHSLLSKHPLKHNVIDRDKIVVPPNWDSWGKIRVLREGFDVEQISNGWSIDIGQPLPPSRAGGGTAEDGTEQEDAGADPEGSIVPLYEAAVHDPSLDALQLAGRDTHSTKLEVETTDTQTFLAEQLRYLESFRQKMEGTAREASRTKTTPRKTDAEEGDFAVGRAAAGEGRLNDHIGPVQFNVGGIQVDADDIVQRLKDRQVYGSSPEPASPEADHAIEDPRDTDTMQAFFNQLMKRGGHRTERLAGQGKAGDT